MFRAGTHRKCLIRVRPLQRREAPALWPYSARWLWASGNPGRPSNANRQKDEWELAAVFNYAAFCNVSTTDIFLTRVIILSMPIWVRWYFGNWFWILDPFLLEPSCWDPFYQCLWAEAQVILPLRPSSMVPAVTPVWPSAGWFSFLDFSFIVWKMRGLCLMILLLKHFWESICMLGSLAWTRK